MDLSQWVEQCVRHTRRELSTSHRNRQYRISHDRRAHLCFCAQHDYTPVSESLEDVPLETRYVQMKNIAHSTCSRSSNAESQVKFVTRRHLIQRNTQCYTPSNASNEQNRYFNDTGDFCSTIELKLNNFHVWQTKKNGIQHYSKL